MTEVFERLVTAGIQLLPGTGITTHFVFERDGFVSLVERRAEEFGSVGAPGLLTDHGIALLVWRGTEAWFVRKGFEARATEEQVAQMRSFASDLEQALRPATG